MRKNNKGFVVTEVLILSTLVIGILVFMYSQFKSINRNYQYSFKYDTVPGMYIANDIVNYINEDTYDKAIDYLKELNLKYVDLADCNALIYENNEFCELLVEKSKISKLIFTKEDLIDIKSDMSELDEDMKKYINHIKPLGDSNDYRIIVKFENGTFATMRFNKGNSYVQNGLIAHLDAINNTGNGHTNDALTWIDLSGHGNDATLYNNPTWSNNSLTFDGLTQYGLLNNTEDIEFSNGFTFETRVNILSFVGTNPSGHIEYLGNWENAGGGFIFDKTYKFRTSFKNIPIAQTTFTSNLNEYCTVFATYDNNTLKWYINGELAATVSSSSGVLSLSTVPLGIGGNPNRVNNNIVVITHANVEFQNILIYDRALTEQEIQRNYNADMARY